MRHFEIRNATTSTTSEPTFASRSFSSGMHTARSYWPVLVVGGWMLLLRFLCA